MNPMNRSQTKDWVGKFSFEIFGNKIRYDKLIIMEESSSNCSSLKILFAIWLDCKTYGVDTK